jgi:tetratricopeptide (TPR) repeat protein
MAEENESSSGKKHRIIHWNPDAGREQVRRRWTWKRILLWSVGGFIGLLFAAGLVIRVTKLVLGDDIFKPRAERIAGQPDLADATSMFVTRAKAEQMQELALKSLNEVKRIPADHPVQRQQLINMEKALADGLALMSSRDFGKAFGVFEGLRGDTEAFSYNVKIKDEARQGYDKILLRIKELELARSLAPGALEAAFESASVGRQLLADGNFAGAKKLFDEGEAELKKAEHALGQHVHENLLAGQKALSQGEKEQARRAFEAALEKAPGNEVAIQGLKRAENIDRVYALLQQGDKLEKERRFAEAAESYKKAFALDAFSAAAQEGEARAARLEKETKFAAAKTAAESAVKAKDWNKAIAEFQAALKVYPQKADVQAALKSAKESAHREAVQKALAKGFAFEKTHQWREARDAYEETLQLEPEQTEAKEGYIRAGVVIRALLNYERLIEVAEQLANKAEFQAALKHFNDAMNAKPSYLETSERVLQLRALLQQQSRPVEVTFHSDGNTSVSILNFMNPRKIGSNETIRILPGDYQVVGRRKGYRDVQMLLQVRNGTPVPPVTVICNVVDRRG